MTIPSIPRNDLLRSHSEQKNLLRQHLLKTRSSIASADKAHLDHQLCNQLCHYVTQHQISNLAVYLPIRSEPDLMSAYQQLFLHHITLAVPVVTAPDTPLVFAQWQPDTPMVEGAFHTLIPAHIMPVSPQAILLPCVGFNTLCYRLGYGGGYYDRTLNSTPKPHTIGIAYAQTQVEFTHEAHDIPLDVIVTEQTIYERGRA